MLQIRTVLLLSLLSWGFGIACFAQNNSHPDKLPWVKGIFPPKASGMSEFVVARGEGGSLKEARSDAFTGLLHDLGNAAGVSVNSQSINEIKSNLNYDGSTSNYDESNATTNTYKIERENFKVSFSKLSEYYEYNNGRYQLWELYEVAQNNQMLTAKIPEYTTQYGTSALWRSAILPGWGQFHKKKTGRGIAILAAEVTLISGTVYCESMRSDNIRKSQETINTTTVKEYRKRADSWTTRRNMFAGGAIGVYIINLLDATLSKGEIKYVAWIPENIRPVAYADNGIYSYGLRINF